MKTNQPSTKSQGPNIPQKPDSVSGVQTMGHDYAHAIQNGNQTLSDVALEAQKRKLDQYTVDPNKVNLHKKSHTALYATFIVILLIASVALIGYKFVFSPTEPDPYAQFAVKSPLLPNEQIGIRSDQFKNGFEDVIINLATKTPVKENEIVQIYFTDSEVLRAKDVDEEHVVEITNISNLFTLLSPDIPRELSRSLRQNNYVYGLYGTPNNGRSQFLLLKTDNYANTYAGMLAWEKTIIQDLRDILQIDTIEDTIFVDRLSYNKDIRIVETSRKKTVLLYSFIDTNTVLIAKDIDIFRDILTRYHQSPR